MSEPQLVEVTVEQGILRGERVPAQCDGLPYDAFRGIPYAQKPVGPLRFKAPRPPQPWEGVRLALKEGPMAPQVGRGGKTVGNEDCLYLNVYTPQVPSSVVSSSPDHRKGAPWPIMFWIHPGAFFSGTSSSEEFGPELLVAKDVVVVTVTYRLVALGFLSLKSPAATGNYGLKDMLSALRWVKKNGGVFGGNVDQITIFGSSAGGASLSYFQLAPAAKGLFHRGIALSACSLNPCVYCENPRHRTLRLAWTLGATEADLASDENILRFLRSLPAEAIVEAGIKMPPEPEDSVVHLSTLLLPTSEEGLIPDDPEDYVFLPGHPKALMKQGRVTDVPLIMGSCSAEGLLADVLTLADGIRAVPKVLEKYDAHLELALPNEINAILKNDSTKLKNTVQRIREVYFNGGAVCQASRNGFYELLGDSLLNIGILQEARIHAQNSNHPVYFCSFDVKGKLNRISIRLKDRKEELLGACHGDELSYLWTTSATKPWILKLEPDSLEAQTRHRMVTLWTNFAKTGNPTPEEETTLGGFRWTAVPKNVKTSVPYLHIGETLSIPTAGLFQKRVELWDSLFSELK